MDQFSCVAPLVGAWIEITSRSLLHATHPVAPLVGAWIEIHKGYVYGRGYQSLPLWERGLKSPPLLKNTCVYLSLPLWERGLKYEKARNFGSGLASLPLWERGLKFFTWREKSRLFVAPLVGAWIEIGSATMLQSGIPYRRSPCGSVD